MAKQIKYTEQFRKEAIEMYLKSDTSAAQVARKLGIHEHTLCRWLQLYERDHTASSQAVNCQLELKEKPCVVPELDFDFSHALEYIRAIKRQVNALEQLLLQQASYEEAQG